MVLTLLPAVKRRFWCFWRSRNWHATGRICHRLRVCKNVWVKSVFLFEGQTSKAHAPLLVSARPAPAISCILDVLSILDVLACPQR